jgi:hypothetical protein
MVNTGSKKSTTKTSKKKSKSKSASSIDNTGLIKSDYTNPKYHRRVPWLHIDTTKHGTVDDSVVAIQHPSVWVKFRRVLVKRSKQVNFDDDLQDSDDDNDDVSRMIINILYNNLYYYAVF